MDGLGLSSEEVSRSCGNRQPLDHQRAIPPNSNPNQPSSPGKRFGPSPSSSPTLPRLKLRKVEEEDDDDDSLLALAMAASLDSSLYPVLEDLVLEDGQ